MNVVLHIPDDFAERLAPTEMSSAWRSKGWRWNHSAPVD
jgi:hypothetical protein